MADFNIPILTGEETSEELLQVVARMQKLLNWIMQGRVSSKNVREIGGYNVDLTTLQSIDGDVGLSSANDADDPVRLWAGSSIKEEAPWRVYKSGYGVATGWLIQSVDGDYPKIIMDPDGDLFGAYTSDTQYLDVGASSSGTGTPYVEWVDDDNGRRAIIFMSPTIGYVIQTTSGITLAPGTGRVSFPSWTKIFNELTSRNLQQDLDWLQTQINSLQSQINSLDSRVSALESA